MALAFKPFAALAAAALLSLGACATSGAYGGGDLRARTGPPRPAPARDAFGYPGGEGNFGPTLAIAPPLVAQAPLLEGHDGLLSSPPNDARAGDCYAKVVVPGQPIPAPPAQPRAVWVPTPAGPGRVGPTWCLYYLPGAPQPVAFTPERFGWIRVVCDKDATVDKIRHIQERLNEWGDYQGPYDGHFNDATAKSVARFQDERHIAHGGYLSMKTVEALDAAPPPAPVQPPVYASPIYQQAPAPQPYPPTYGQQVSMPPMYQVPVYQQPAYPSVPAPCQTCGGSRGYNPYGQVGYGPYGPGLYGPGGAPPYRALLTWPGKSIY
jgi:peptidoglycan hydrolase-like protein with peptidoglycan-binding domain